MCLLLPMCSPTFLYFFQQCIARIHARAVQANIGAGENGIVFIEFSARSRARVYTCNQSNDMLETGLAECNIRKYIQKA